MSVNPTTKHRNAGSGVRSAMVSRTRNTNRSMSSTGYDAFTKVANVGPDPWTPLLSTTTHRITASPTAPTSASAVASSNVLQSLFTT